MTRDTTDSAMYIHPLRVLNQGSPLVKYSALSNYNDDQFIWQGLERQSEIPELISYIEEKQIILLKLSQILLMILRKIKTKVCANH